MTTWNRSTSWALVCMMVISAPALAQEQSGEDLLKTLNYPELEVTPRASERLRIEAEKERYNRWLLNWPIQLSALATLTSGIKASGRPRLGASDSMKESNEWASKAAVFVGGAWLGATFWAAASYRPYLQGYREIHSRPKETKRDQLAVERYAEEALAQPARFARPMRWLSVVSNLAASGYVVFTADSEARIIGWISVALAFTPWLFEPHWQAVHEQHQIYKKKIYGPVSSLTLLADNTGGMVPGYMWTMSF